MPLSSHIITIQSLGGLGDGIADMGGKPLFIPKSCAGDVVRVRITEDKAQEVRGEIVEIVSPGPDRIIPPCPYYNDCGGCSLMHLSESAYQEFKRRHFHNALQRGGFDIPAEIVFLPPATRRRAEFKFDGKQLCYYRPRSRTLVPIGNCLIITPALQALMAPLAAALTALPFAEQIKTVGVTAADSGIDLVIGFSSVPEKKDMASRCKALAEGLGIARVSVRYPDESVQVMHERMAVEMQLGDWRIGLPVEAFLQATSDGQALLTEIVLGTVKPGQRVADLFCGIGTYSFPLAGRAMVHAVEFDAAMVATLQGAIKRHGLNGRMSAEARDLFKQPLSAAELKRFDAVVLNPPRIGAKKQVEQLATSNVSTVVMISCNQASWARDAEILKKGGFTLGSAVGIDQFVFSPHFEIASVFTR